MKKYIEKGFTGFDPFEITQNLRGTIFLKVDILMTNSYDAKSLQSSILNVVDILYDYLDFSIEYLEFFKKNLYYQELLEKCQDLFLVDEKAAVIASLFEIFINLKRIFGRDERINNAFFKVNFIQIAI